MYCECNGHQQVASCKLQVQVHLFPHRHQAKCSGRAKSGRIERWTVMDNTWNSKMILQVWRAAAATHQPSTQIREKAVAFYFLMVLQTPSSCPAREELVDRSDSCSFRSCCLLSPARNYSKQTLGMKNPWPWKLTVQIIKLSVLLDLLFLLLN